MALQKRNLLSGKSVLLVEPESKTTNDKTFCFWGEPTDSMVKDLEPLITHSWSSVSIAQKESLSLHPLKYWQVSSIHLYQHIHKLSAQQGWTTLNERIEAIFQDEEGPFIASGDCEYRATHFFDSRNPTFAPPTGYQTHLWQSFYGWKVKSEQPVFNPTDFRMMDFNTAQDGYTQFVYVLPYSNCEALIEITRFGTEIIPRDIAELRLQVYLDSMDCQYSIIETEEGCIPMSNAHLHIQKMDGVIPLGGRNKAIKPSTGYAFKTMYQQAETISQQCQVLEQRSIENPNSDSLKKLTIEFNQAPARFEFYDSLLLRILHQQPQFGKPIFETLFNRVKIPRVLTFLDEKTSLTQDIGILKELPFYPFLKALAQNPWTQSMIRPLCLLLTSLMLLILGPWPALQNCMGNGLLVVGLLFVGIPHGAVDHLLETGKWDQRIAPTFIIKYLLISIGLALFWMIFPNAALGIFLAYSAWHFGQADGALWKLKPWTSMAWGISVLAYILCTNTAESAQIIQGISTWTFSSTLPVYALLPWLIFALITGRWGLFITTIWLMSSSQLPLLWSFGLYFIGQHSINGWNKIKNHLQITHARLWVKSLPFHIGAWGLLAVFYRSWEQYAREIQSSHSMPFSDSLKTSLDSHHSSMIELLNSHAGELSSWAPFFIFIACISLPHTIAMHKLYGKDAGA